MADVRCGFCQQRFAPGGAAGALATIAREALLLHLIFVHTLDAERRSHGA